MFKTRRALVLVLALVAFAVTACAPRGRTALAPGGAGPAAVADVRLVVFVVVDQLNAPALAEIRGRLGPGGFRAVLDRGAWFREARYRHSVTLTAVGHASLYTGGNVPEHGIASNDWLDPATGAFVYAAEDDRHRILGEATRAHDGTSPRNLTSTTSGDELVLATGGRSRVFAVSLKDRTAIFGAGRLGKAFWFSTSTGRFVSSDFYYPALPAWAEAWNAARPVERFRGASWTLAREDAAYVRRADDDRPEERDAYGLGRVFPHRVAPARPEDLPRAVQTTPFGDELMTDFALELAAREGLGRGPAPDMLVLSYTATDYIGHNFGPRSLEYEDDLFRLDAQLARLFGALERQAGPGRMLVVLASDHGGDDVPEAWSRLGYPGGRVRPAELVERVERALKARFGAAGRTVRSFLSPNLYLDEAAIARAGGTIEEAERIAAAELARADGTLLALARTDVLRGALPRDPVLGKAALSFHPRRSGNVFLVQAPFWYLDTEPGPYRAMHGSPYEYDTHVPVAFAGPGIPAGQVWRAVCPESVAATLAALLNTAAPSGSSAPVLEEVLRGRTPGS